MEQWKDIKDYQGIYQVSSYGRIKSFNKWNGHRFIKEERILKPTLHIERGNYKRNTICLSKKKKRKHFKIHRLVGLAFIPNPLNKPEINHIDSNPLNNNVNNLEWVTRQENIVHSIAFGYRQPKYDIKNIIEDYNNNLPTKDITFKHKITTTIFYNVLKRNNVDKQPLNERLSIYHIPMEQLLIDFKNGMRNVDIAIKYKTNSQLIAVYKYKFKKEGKL